MAASAGGKAALALWVDIDPADDSAFEHWHSREHVQERVACPGWLRGSRFKGVEKPGAISSSTTPKRCRRSKATPTTPACAIRPG